MRIGRSGRHGRRGFHHQGDPLVLRLARWHRRRPSRHRPADRLAREGVYRGRQAKPALSGRHAGHASDPEPVPLAHGEDAVDEVRARVARLSLLCGLMPPGRPFGDDPWLPHDMRHALTARDDAAAAQFSVDAPAAAAALTPAERIDDEPFERLALDPGIRLLPLVEARFRRLQQRACLLDGAEPAPMPFEEPKPRARS